MDLPTYTSIWRIEKRLYKLYDFRLPMPLPIGQVTIFVALGVPYVGLLTLAGVPFNHTLIWLYILPPGAATWLVTRPVLESKRLPELVKSQMRYLAEPRILCRMAPLAERDVVVVTGKVWRPRASGHRSAAGEPAEGPAGTPDEMPDATPGPAVRAATTGGPARPPALWQSVPPRAASSARPAGRAGSAAPAASAGPFRPAPQAIWPSAPARARGADAAWPAAGPGAAAGDSDGVGSRWPHRESPTAPGAQAPEPPAQAPAEPTPAESAPAAQAPAEPSRAESAPAEPGPVVPAAPRPSASVVQPRPVVTVVGADRARSAPPTVERALAGPAARRADLRAGPVTVVPGGHRPGKPDLLQRDRTRVQLPIGFSARIIVLGCTVGAGQTMTALMLGDVLASLRGDRVAAVDLNPGTGSLTGRAKARPAHSHAASARSSRLTIIGSQPEPGGATNGVAEPTAPAEPAAPAAPPRDPDADALRFEAAAHQHDLVIADPASAAFPRLLAIADQLILVAPASAAAPGAIAMTFEWLDAHGRHDLATTSVMVLNGVSRRSVTHVEQAERVCVGRCRAIVRVPWDDRLDRRAAKRSVPPTPGSPAGQQWAGVLNSATAGAYTALAGVVVASLHDRRTTEDSESEPAGRARR